MKDHRASLSVDFSTYEYAVVEWVAGLVQKTRRSRIHGSLAAWNGSIFRKETVSPPSFPESDGKTTSGGSIATPESLRNEPGNRKRASILVFATPPVLLLSICAPCFTPPPANCSLRSLVAFRTDERSIRFLLVEARFLRNKQSRSIGRTPVRLEEVSKLLKRSCLPVRNVVPWNERYKLLYLILL